jgi:RNA polymerase sigma factor (TIGR02999 family)
MSPWVPDRLATCPTSRGRVDGRRELCRPEHSDELFGFVASHRLEKSLLPYRAGTMSDITRILNEGQSHRAAELLPLVYDELRKLAAARLSAEAPEHTLQPTALVHEVYLRLIGPADDERWANRGHFFGAAAEGMRRILVDSARRKAAIRHGGDRTRLELAPELAFAPEVREDLLALDEALDQLNAEDPLKAELVKLRYFAGLTLPEAAAALGLSERTAGRHWAFARAWLRQRVEGTDKRI